MALHCQEETKKKEYITILEAIYTKTDSKALGKIWSGGERSSDSVQVKDMIL
jgi:hypothetical protein